MRKRLKRKDERRASSLPDDYLGYSRSRVRAVPGRMLYITTYLPRPVAIKARREIYTYPYPKQVRKRGRTIRLSLARSRVPMVKTKVRIRLPRRLPVVRGSYVSLADGRLNIHSLYQLERLYDAQEPNRRRYSEYKGNRRKASYGQLDSRGSQRFGSVAHAYRQGSSIDKIADAALAVRAIAQNRR